MVHRAKLVFQDPQGFQGPLDSLVSRVPQVLWVPLARWDPREVRELAVPRVTWELPG